MQWVTTTSPAQRPPRGPDLPGSFLRRLQLEAGGMVGLAVIAVVGSIGIAAGASSPLVGRAAIGLVAVAILAYFALSSPGLAVRVIFGWLILFGFIRRLLIPFAGWSTSDPLLLVGPLTAILILLARRGQPRPQRNILVVLVVFLGLWTVGEVFNPSTYDVLTNLQGEFFWGAPLLWFFVGRALTNGEHDRIHRLALWMTIPVLISGLYQSFIGFLPFELHWLSLSGPGAAIFLNGFRIRPFSTLNSPQEYGVFCGIALTLMWARWLHRPREWRWIAPFMVVTTVALLLQSSRGILLLTILALAVQAMVRFRSLAVLLAAGSLIGGIFLFANPYAQGSPPPGVVFPTAQNNGSTSSGDQATSTLLTHEFEGLQNPAQSTAPIHVQIITQGFAAGLNHPFGLGTAATTIAAARTNPAAANNTGFASAEEDIANAAPALGLPGDIVLMVIVVVGLVYAVRAEWRRPGIRHLGWLGVMVACIGQWLNGNLYATSPFLLLCLGGLSCAAAPSVSRWAATRGRPRTLLDDVSGA